MPPWARRTPAPATHADDESHPQQPTREVAGELGRRTMRCVAARRDLRGLRTSVTNPLASFHVTFRLPRRSLPRLLSGALLRRSLPRLLSGALLRCALPRVLGGALFSCALP